MNTLEKRLEKLNEWKRGLVYTFSKETKWELIKSLERIKEIDPNEWKLHAYMSWIDVVSFVQKPKQTIKAKNAANSGTYTITFDGKTTAPIAWNDNEARIKAALELAGLKDLEVVGDMTTTIKIFFGGIYVYNYNGNKRVVIDSRNLKDVAGKIVDTKTEIHNKPIDNLTVKETLRNKEKYGEEEQQITATVQPQWGYYTLTFENKTTDPIAWDTNNTDIKKALENKDPKRKDLDITWALNTAGNITITFKWIYEGKRQKSIEIDSSKLTISTTTQLPSNATIQKIKPEQKVQTGKKATKGTYTITFDGKTTAPIAWNANEATIENELQTAGLRDISVTGKMNNNLTFTFDGKQYQNNTDLITIDNKELEAGGIKPLATRVQEENQQQKITVNNKPKEWYYTITINGTKTDPLKFDAEKSDIEDAIKAKGIAGITITWKINDWEITIKFDKTIYTTAQDLVSIDTSLLKSDGTAPLTVPPKVKRIVEPKKYCIAVDDKTGTYILLKENETDPKKREPITNMEFFVKHIQSTQNKTGLIIQKSTNANRETIDKIRQE